MTSELLKGVFPDHVEVASAVLDGNSPVDCAFPEEAALIEKAIHKRQAEFAAGRRLAHESLAKLREAGASIEPAAPLLVAANGSPTWPAGSTGTISHTKGLCVVAVSAQSNEPRLGLDIEPTGPLKEKLWPTVLTVSERALLKGLGTRGALLSKVYFSAKETVYKLVSQDVGRVLRFSEVEISLSMARGTFTAEFLLREEPPVELPQVQGQWRVTKDYILTTAIGR